MTFLYGAIMNIQAHHLYPVVHAPKMEDRFEELCVEAVEYGLRNRTAEEFEQEFAVRLDDSLQRFLGRPISRTTENDIIVYLVHASRGLIGSEEAASIADKILYQNCQYHLDKENNRLQ
uniref:Uncharacterized protein n=1 Tax=Ochrobactrum phage ORM_20 TaxID=2985243 RepID=A0A9N6ZG52_9VIRU|nr:hypothetical protein ORM20_00249 [Ochrobactrum phage ORM_20]